MSFGWFCQAAFWNKVSTWSISQGNGADHRDLGGSLSLNRWHHHIGRDNPRVQREAEASIGTHMVWNPTSKLLLLRDKLSAQEKEVPHRTCQDKTGVFHIMDWLTLMTNSSPIWLQKQHASVKSYNRMIHLKGQINRGPDWKSMPGSNVRVVLINRWCWSSSYRTALWSRKEPGSRWRPPKVTTPTSDKLRWMAETRRMTQSCRVLLNAASMRDCCHERAGLLSHGLWKWTCGTRYMKTTSGKVQKEGEGGSLLASNE